MRSFSCAFCFLVAFAACSKNEDNSIASSVYIDAAGHWYITGVQAKGIVNYTFNNDQYPCLTDNKYELNDDKNGGYFFNSTDTCYLDKTSSSSIVLGVPDAGGPFSWLQVKDTIFITYLQGNIDTAIVNKNSSGEYLTITNHYPGVSYVYTCTR
ncbi:hypothetical protein I5907_18405 [Panacibacter sp. DH6]|uniref:Lipocalin-like domain-containing protein n=1 Tax=Panacibacter microcysteis TaxID=2793269 RepID=A0A931MCS8_9BACT|nr:hypothetical protein [Panacibacter microcysteis]MBG9378217.1 hypothetical protein [Panacibacter microcysteis]